MLYTAAAAAASAGDDLSDDRVPSIARTSPFRRNVICIGTITTTADTASHNEKSGGERERERPDGCGVHIKYVRLWQRRV